MSTPRACHMWCKAHPLFCLLLSGVLMSREEIDEAAKICAEAGCWLLLGKWVSELQVHYYWPALLAPLVPPGPAPLPAPRLSQTSSPLVLPDALPPSLPPSLPQTTRTRTLCIRSGLTTAIRIPTSSTSSGGECVC